MASANTILAALRAQSAKTQECEGPDFFESLPDEVVDKILRCLTSENLCAIATQCRRLCRIARGIQVGTSGAPLRDILAASQRAFNKFKETTNLSWITPSKMPLLKHREQATLLAAETHILEQASILEIQRVAQFLGIDVSRDVVVILCNGLYEANREQELLSLLSHLPFKKIPNYFYRDLYASDTEKVLLQSILTAVANDRSLLKKAATVADYMDLDDCKKIFSCIPEQERLAYANTPLCDRLLPYFIESKNWPFVVATTQTGDPETYSYKSRISILQQILDDPAVPIENIARLLPQVFQPYTHWQSREGIIAVAYKELLTHLVNVKEDFAKALQIAQNSKIPDLLHVLCEQFLEKKLYNQALQAFSLLPPENQDHSSFLSPHNVCLDNGALYQATRFARILQGPEKINAFVAIFDAHMEKSDPESAIQSLKQIPFFQTLFLENIAPYQRLVEYYTSQNTPEKIDPTLARLTNDDPGLLSLLKETLQLPTE